MRSGKPGQFDILVDGQLFLGKQSVGIWRRLLGNHGFPEPDAVVEALRRRSEPGSGPLLPP